VQQRNPRDSTSCRGRSSRHTRSAATEGCSLPRCHRCYRATCRSRSLAVLAALARRSRLRLQGSRQPRAAQTVATPAMQHTRTKVEPRTLADFCLSYRSIAVAVASKLRLGTACRTAVVSVFMRGCGDSAAGRPAHSAAATGFVDAYLCGMLVMSALRWAYGARALPCRRRVEKFADPRCRPAVSRGCIKRSGFGLSIVREGVNRTPCIVPAR